MLNNYVDEPSPEFATPWYRIPIMWLVVGLPVTAVVAGTVTFFIAAASFDGLVTDDYYKRGLEINRVLKREAAATSFGLEIDLKLSDSNKTSRIYLHGTDSFAPPTTVRVTFVHRTVAGKDVAFSSSAIARGVYEFASPSLVSGPWFVVVETDDWRVSQPLRIK